ncbi:helix-turn-helix domain-containing protein [Polymorphobacter sp. PAMC 29334]|uniref:helix-turn-helix domain-containing protein n=1 Tax=Polymorphobacter sp. PAMC 29334 TaxID=2862331 RepID=UPI001C664B3C|nr:helix-turn-helix domain-containing protein [Polymorphobacter sp. PAMC 29334]QYE36063.1 helix-turn-helix domain-containing protein [Polymorphobacter sp. PAMC 29334]
MDTEVTAAGDDFAHGRRVGAILGDARTAAGLELIDIARDTRVPVRHLAAIEADAHDSLPALPYAIGFVKAFARAVGVDPEAAGAQFRAETSKVAHVPAPPPMSPLDERRLPPRGLVTVSIVAVLAVIAAVVAWSAGAFDGASRPTSAPVVAAAPPVVSPAETAAASPATPPAADSTAIAGTPAAAVPTSPAVTPAVAPVAMSPAAPGSGHIVITASDDAWFRISAYDATARKVVTVKTGVLAKGEHYEVTPVPGQRLWTGRAGALQISVDGRALPPLGGPVETVKNVSLDAADLRARLAAPATPR